jgi:hypothetical protein
LRRPDASDRRPPKTAVATMPSVYSRIMISRPVSGSASLTRSVRKYSRYSVPSALPSWTRKRVANAHAKSGWLLMSIRQLVLSIRTDGGSGSSGVSSANGTASMANATAIAT